MTSDGVRQLVTTPLLVPLLLLCIKLTLRQMTIKICQARLNNIQGEAKESRHVNVNCTDGLSVATPSGGGVSMARLAHDTHRVYFCCHWPRLGDEIFRGERFLSFTVPFSFSVLVSTFVRCWSRVAALACCEHLSAVMMFAKNANLVVCTSS